MLTIVDRYGRRWEELDALRALVNTPGAFVMKSEDGHPLVGRSVPGQVPVQHVAAGWRVQGAV